MTAPCTEKLYTWTGPEFGKDEREPLIIVRDLYVIRSAGASFRSFLAEHLDNTNSDHQ